MPTADFITVESIAASESAFTGLPLDTLKLRYPRMVHADFMTHRVFSRNASSSRAIPIGRMLAMDPPYVPRFRHNQAGMQPGEYLSAADQAQAERVWLTLAKQTAEAVTYLADKGGLNIHKQWVNRPTEWFGYITVVVSATDFVNFLGLRDDAAAQDEIQALAKQVRAALAGVRRQVLNPGEWHLPFIQDEDRYTVAKLLRDEPSQAGELLAQVAFAFANLPSAADDQRLLIPMSAARCARASYNDFDGSRATPQRDVGTFLKLAGSRPVHASPLEHQARPALYQSPYCGNFEGWEQFRKLVPGERIIG